MEGTDQNLYVISLDALDLNLLPAIYSSRDDRVAPLWRKSNLDRRNNEYYQFEIKSKDSAENVKDETPKLENVTCDICNIDVPKQYFSKHRKSSRHTSNVKIADIALHRMKKYVNNMYNGNYCTTDDEIDPAAFFCTTCVTIVDSKEKAAHNKSLAHKNSVILEKMFNNFLSLYDCQEEIDDGSTKNESKINKKHLDPKINDAMLSSTNKTEFLLNKVAKLNKEKKTDTSDKIINIRHNEALTAQNENIRMSLEDYISLLNNRVKHPMIFKLNNHNTHLIEIETIDGSVVKLREGNFHGLNRVGKSLMQCHPCKEIFKEELIEEHKMSEKHIQYMVAPLENKHCARKIDDSSSHCLICNAITEYSLVHLLCNKDHEDKLKEALVSDKFVEDNQYLHRELYKDSTAANTDTCQKDKWIDVTKNTGNVDVKNNDKTNEGELPSEIPNRYFCTSCNEYISTFRRTKHNATMKHILNSKSEYHYLMTETENQLFCRVCDVAVINNIEHVKKHVFEEEHLRIYNRKLADNKMKLSKGIFYCEPCDEVVSIKHELMHVNAKSHQAKCSLVECIEAVTEEIEQDNEKIPTEFFQCGVCYVKVPNNELNIQEHMNGRSHAAKVKETNHISDDDDECDSNITETAPDIHYLMEQTKFSKLVNCKVCNTLILDNETSVSAHLASVKHSVQYNKLLKDNDLILKTNDCYCNVCKVSVGIKSELIHANGKKHNRMLKQKLVTSNASVASESSANAYTKASVDKQSTSNRYIDKPSVSNVKDMNNRDTLISKSSNNLLSEENPDIPKEMLAMVLPTRNPKEVICKVCKVTLPFNVHNVVTHMNGMKHKQAFVTYFRDVAAIQSS